MTLLKKITIVRCFNKINMNIFFFTNEINTLLLEINNNMSVPG